MKRVLLLLCAAGCSQIRPQAIPNRLEEVRSVEQVVAGPRGPIAALEKFTESNAARPAILLLHGKDSRSVFDLRLRDYSLMEFLAQHQFDVWALDGDDVDAAVDTIRKLRGVAQVDLLGWSWGAAAAGLYAARHPESVRKLILYAPVWKKSAEEQDANAFAVGEVEPDVLGAYLQIPEAPRDDLAALDPAAIRVPTLIVHGEKDPVSVESELTPLFTALGTHDKEYVMLPFGGHAVMLEKRRRTFQHAVLSFLLR